MTSIISPPSRRCYHSCRRSSLIRRDTAITNLRRKPYHRSKLFSDLACSTSGRETRYRQSVWQEQIRHFHAMYRRLMSLVKLSALFRPETRSPGQVFCVTVSTGAASSLKTSTRQRQQQRRQQRRRRRRQQQQQQRRRRAHLPSADLPVARRKTTPRCIVVTRHHRPQRHRRAPAYRHWRSQTATTPSGQHIRGSGK